MTTYRITLTATGNPDRNQAADIGVPPAVYDIDTLEEATDITLAYIGRNNLGSGNFPEAEIRGSRGELVAKVSYNGRVWPMAKREAGIDWNEYDGVELHSLIRLDDGTEETCCDGATPDFHAVFLHRVSGGTECAADFEATTLGVELAREFARLLVDNHGTLQKHDVVDFLETN